MRTGIAIAESDQSDRRILEVLVGMMGHQARLCDSHAALMEVLPSVECVVVSKPFGTKEFADLIADVNKTRSEVPVICLIQRPQVSEVVRVLKAGANNVLEKPFSGRQLQLAVDEALLERREQQDRNVIPEYLREGLTDEEAAILQSLTEGKTVKEIARTLQISIRTVHYRKSGLLQHFGFESRKQLVQYVRGQMASQRQESSAATGGRTRIDGPTLPFRRPSLSPASRLPGQTAGEFAPVDYSTSGV